MNFDATQIAAATGGELVRDGAAGPVLTDSRAFAPGAWFLALVGERFDGHRFLAQVAAERPAGCIVEQVPEHWPAGAVRVPDTTRALQDLGRAARDRIRGPVIAVTGSSGKTTTRALVALGVSGLGPVHQTMGNLNNQLGVPMTLCAAPETSAAVVVEMGTSSPGEIGLLADIARPDVRLLVNVGPAHLLELGGLEGVAREKGTLFATARHGDVICQNLDDPFIAAMSTPRGARVVTYGRAAGATIRLVDARIEPDTLATVARFLTPTGPVDLRLPVPGHHIAHNAAGALAVAHALGLELGAAALAMQAYEPVGMRMRIEALEGGATVINDAYNANPGSMEASLRVLAELPGRRVAVLGDMLELGAEEGAWHDKIAALAVSLGLDLVVLTGPMMAAAGSRLDRAPPEVWIEPDPDAVTPRLRAWLRSGDRVLFKGSRGIRVERILQSLREKG